MNTADPKMPSRFTPKLVEKSRKSQRALLSKALSLVKPGGIVVYSTCSVLACENEDIVEACLKGAQRAGTFEVEPIDFARFEGAPLLPTRLEGALCLCPDELYEGFFVAAIKRTA